MPNPIPYKDLFDVDGLKLAVKELTIETDAYGAAATEDFKRINSVVSALKKELEGLSVTMSKPIKLMDDSGQAQVKEYATQISELTRQVKTQQAAIESMNKIMTEQKQVIMDAKVAAAQYAEQLKAEQVETQKVRTEIASKTLALKELALNTKSATNAQTAANGSYKEATNQLREMGLAIRNAEGGFEGLTPEIQKQITEYNNLNNKIKDFDAKMGNFQKNVGNYKSGFNGLNNSINQISRELPAFTFSAQTGFLALSNNLPILADNIKSTKDQIVAMRAEGQKVPSLFSQIASAVFSWQTLLSIGVTLITVYGKEIGNLFSGLFKGNSIIDETKERFNDLNKALASTEFSKAVTDVNRLTLEFELARKGVMNKEEVLKDYNDTLGKTLGITDDFNAAEQATIDNAKKIIETTLYKAAANLSLQESAKKVYETRQKNLEIEDKLNDVVKNGTGFAKAFEITSYKRDIQKNNDELASYLKTANGIATGFLTQAATISGGYKKITTEISDSQLTTYEQIKNRISELSKLPGSAIDGSAINNRIDALKARLKELNSTSKEAKDGLALLEEQLNKIAVQLQNAIINDYAKNQGKETENTKKLADAYAVLSNKIKDVQKAQKDQQESAQRRIDFANRGNNPVLSAIGTTPTDLAGGIASATTKASLIQELESVESFGQQIEAAYKVMNDGIFKQYKYRKITLAQYNEQIQIAEDSAAEDVYENDKKAADVRIKLAITQYGKSSKEYINALKSRGDLEEKYNKDSLSREERLYAAKLKLQQETIAVLQKSANTISRLTGNSGLGALFGDISTDLINGIGDGEKFQKVAELGMDAINAYTEFAINASNQRIDQLNKERDHDIGLAGNNAEAKAKIEEEYNKKVAAEKTKQAKLARAAAAIDIIINTAVAVSKVIGQTGIFGIGLAPIVAALGAIELGIVLAQPLPQYAKGRNGGEAEFAEVNERGPELIGQRGKWRLANRGMRGVTFLNKGDEVKTATDTKQMLANGMITADGQYVNNVSQSKAIYDQYIMASNRSSEIDYSRMAGAIADGVSGLPVSEHNYNERGYQQNLRIKNTRQLNINKRNRF